MTGIQPPDAPIAPALEPAPLTFPFAFLPPELWPSILAGLPRPSSSPYDSSATPTSRPRTAPLLAFSLVSREFRRLAQALLFERAELEYAERVEAWAGADARRATVELVVMCGEDPGMQELMDGEVVEDDVEGPLRAGLKGKGLGEGRQLEVLEIDVANEQVLSSEFWRMQELKGLRSLSTNINIPLALAGHSLRHLNLTDGVFEFNPPHLPHLTHLTFGWYLPSGCSPLATAFPSLTYLAVGTLATAINTPGSDFLSELSHIIPPGLTEFVTFSQISSGVCRVLPNGLARLTAGARSGRELAAIRERWFPTVAGRNAGPGALKALRLRLKESADEASDWLEEELELGRSEVNRIKQAGCVVTMEHRPWHGQIRLMDAEWRGERWWTDGTS